MCVSHVGWYSDWKRSTSFGSYLDYNTQHNVNRTSINSLNFVMRAFSLFLFVLHYHCAIHLFSEWKFKTSKFFIDVIFGSCLIYQSDSASGTAGPQMITISNKMIKCGRIKATHKLCLNECKVPLSVTDANTNDLIELLSQPIQNNPISAVFGQTWQSWIQMMIIKHKQIPLSTCLIILQAIFPRYVSIINRLLNP